MNIFFGAVSLAQAGQFEDMRAAVEKLFAFPASVLAGTDGAMPCGYISDGGVVLGKAAEGDDYLVYLGFLQRPLPGWDAGSPVDDPDHTAAYLLSRYREHGAGFLEGVHGQYALAIHDGSVSKLMLACDPGGYRRLFYRYRDGNLVYGTSLAALSAGAGLAIDRSMEDFLLGFEFLPWNRTVYDGVSSLAAGTLLEFSADGLTTRQLATPAPSGSKMTAADEDAVIASLEEEFMGTVGQLCPTDKRVAVLLGGFDSALIAAALVRLGKEVETFTFRYADERFNQAYTDMLAEHLGTTHTWVDIGPEELGKTIPDYALLFNQPVGQMHYVLHTALACSAIRQKGYLHCLTGDGCDEVFLGYPTVHRRAQLFNRLGHLPKPAVSALLYLFHGYFFEKRLGHVYRLGRNFITILGRKMPVRNHICHRVFDGISLDRLRTGAAPAQEKDIEQMLQELAAGLESMSSVRLAYHGKSMVGLNRNKVEGCSAVSGLSLQSPFQHRNLTRFARSLPDALLRPEKKTRSAVTGKYVLMEMAERSGLLPAGIIYQKKASPVTAPVDYWYMDSLKAVMLGAVRDLPFEYDPEYVEDLLRHKLAEDVFRKHVGIGHYASHAISLLASYASFARYGNTGDIHGGVSGK